MNKLGRILDESIVQIHRGIRGIEAAGRWGLQEAIVRYSLAPAALRRAGQGQALGPNSTSALWPSAGAQATYRKRARTPCCFPGEAVISSCQEWALVLSRPDQIFLPGV